MNACVLVSANAGWNLFIGAAEGATGTWVPIERLGVPSACKTVWGEAEKDACFGAAGRAAVVRDPLRFLALVPSKLGATFDYTGAAGWYLHSSSAAAFDERAKTALGVAETIWQRVIVLLGLVALGRAAGPNARIRQALAGLASICLLSAPRTCGSSSLVALALLLGRRLPENPVAALAGATVLVTAATHAAFFGAGRYSLVCFPALAALAGTVLTARKRAGDTGGTARART